MRKIETLFQKRKNKSRVKKRQGKSVVHDGCSQKFYIKKTISSHNLKRDNRFETRRDRDSRQRTVRNAPRTGLEPSIPYSHEPVAASRGRTSRSFVDTHDIGYMALSWRYKNIGCGLCVLTFLSICSTRLALPWTI